MSITTCSVKPEGEGDCEGVDVCDAASDDVLLCEALAVSDGLCDGVTELVHAWLGVCEGVAACEGV